MALELAQILRQSDPGDARLQAVERFATEHDRLPKVGGPLPREHACATWLAVVGMSMKRQKLPAVKVQKLLNSSDILRTRVLRWLTPDMRFKLHCKDFKEFVRQHKRLPKRSVQGEKRL